MKPLPDEITRADRSSSQESWLSHFVTLTLCQQLLADAGVDAGVVRFRPMLLTAPTVLASASVILSGPIFQGLALSQMAGEVASTLLSRTAVSILDSIVESRMQASAKPVSLVEQ